MSDLLAQIIDEFLRTAAEPGRKPASHEFAPIVIEAPSRRTIEQLYSSGYRHVRRFGVLPSLSHPRLLLPLAGSHCIRSAMTLYAPYARMARFMKQLIVPFSTAPLAWRLLNTIVIATRKPLPIESLVCQVMRESDPTFAFLVGTPHPCRKLTIQIMSNTGTILAYAKLPLTSAAEERVRHEGRMLERLNRFASLQGLIPSVLYAGEWNGTYVLFQSPLVGASGPERLGYMHTEFLERLRHTVPSKKPGGVLVAETRSRFRRTKMLLSSKHRELCEGVLSRAGQQLESQTVLCGPSHGDFAPWNTRTADGRLFVFDWEASCWSAPGLWDVLHFAAQTAGLLGKRWSTPELPQDLRTSTEPLRLLYLVSSASRILEEQPECSSAINRFMSQHTDHMKAVLAGSDSTNHVPANAAHVL